MESRRLGGAPCCSASCVLYDSRMRPPKITSVRPFTGLYPFGTRHHIFGAGLFAARVWTVTFVVTAACTRTVKKATLIVKLERISSFLQ